MSRKLDFTNEKLHNINNFYNNYFHLINTAILVFIILIIALIYTIKTDIKKETEKTDIDIVDIAESTKSTTTQKGYVYITGEVVNEGIYELTDNLRITDLIKLAGGLTENASLLNINLAQKLYDEDHIQILSNSEVEEMGITRENSQSTNPLININNATKEDLMTINGVGEVTANTIIKYREENGKFETKEDLKKVSGIGDKTYEKLESQIRVN